MQSQEEVREEELGQGLVNNVLNIFKFLLNSGSPIWWTKPNSQSLGLAKKCPNPN